MKDCNSEWSENYFFILKCQCDAGLCILTVPIGVVTYLDARIFDLTTVELQWGPVMDEEQNGSIISYNIYYHPNSSNSNPACTVIHSVTDMVCEYIVL